MLKEEEKCNTMQMNQEEILTLENNFVQVLKECSESRDSCKSADISIDSFLSSDFGVPKVKITRIGSGALGPDPLEQLQELRLRSRFSWRISRSSSRVDRPCPCRWA